jgi:hypothetical protein
VSDSDDDSSEFDAADFDGDDRLRALLRGGDPAGSLHPADPAALQSLLEDIMSADLEIRPADPGQAEPHRRTRATWLVAAAAVVAIAAGGAFAVTGLTGNDAGAPQADHQPSTTVEVGAPVKGETTELTADVQARCVAQQTAELLAQYDQAFEGTVTAIEGDTVTLQTTEVYNGQVGETVQVTAPQAGLDKLINQVHFQVGGTYLVSAYQGSVSMCGFSGPATGDLRSLFQKAFVH